MTHLKVCFTLMILFLVTSPFVMLAFADTITTEDIFDMRFLENEAFAVQDSDHDATVTFTMQDGTLNATGELTVTDEYGVFTITPSTSGLIHVTCDIAQVWITINGVTHSGPYSFTSGLTFIARWEWTSAPVLPEPIDDWLLGGDVSLLLTYLMAGDYLGFILACYTTRIGQLAYVLIIMIFTVPLALRTQSITYVAIVWVILGGIFQAAVPLIGPATVILEILGIGALIFRLFAKE